MRVLLAEDNPRAQQVLNAFIANAGFEPVAVGNGVEAWRLLEHEPFPIVVTDWDMPHLNGLELVRKIRSGADRGYSYIIMLTGHSDSSFHEGMAAGADDFLNKPCTAEELGARLSVGRRIMSLQKELQTANQSLLDTNLELREFRNRLQGELELATRFSARCCPHQTASSRASASPGHSSRPPSLPAM